MSDYIVNNSVRISVWSAISDLWIDSEIQDHELDYLAKVLIDSGYTMDELENIYKNEVSPVVWMNLFPLNTAPTVWAGFDQQWLQAEIMSSIDRQQKDPLYRFYVRSWIGQWLRTRAVHNDWCRLKSKIKEKRY
jgi:hypothetical protein